MISTTVEWSWKGVIHEYLHSQQLHRWQTLEGLNIFVQHDGARAKNKNTYLNDIALLEQGLIDEPDNLRYVFYLAQSYRDAGMFEKAREYFLKRAVAVGWEEERWMAQFRAAQMAERLGLDEVIIHREYLKSWISNQSRAEPLYALARYYRLKKDFDLACYFAMQAIDIPSPKDGLFVDASIYEWRALDELAVSATYCKIYKKQGQEAMQKLLTEKKYPKTQQVRMLANEKFYK